MQPLDSITSVIIGDAITVHRELGPGLLESTYKTCLSVLLAGRGLRVEREVSLPLTFMGVELDDGYRVDLIVERRVVVELKSITTFSPVHFSQVATYLKLSGCEIGLLINFNVVRLIDGLRRIVPPNEYLQRTPKPH
jgi:GxxExxY protein